MTTTSPGAARPLSTDALLRTLRIAVARATRAPSVHNTQPWHVTASPDAVILRADRARALNVLDGAGRELIMSCGCLLFNLRVALAAAGLHPVVTRWPDPTDPDVVARLTVRADGTSPDDDLARLAPAMARRHNNRRTFATDPVPTALVEIMHAAARAEGADMVQVGEPAARAALSMLSRRADAQQLADPAYRAELRAWTQDDPLRTDGIPAITVPRVGAGSEEDVPIRDLDTHGRGGLPLRHNSDREQCLVVLGCSTDDAPGWLRAGEALERVMLEIAAFAELPPQAHVAAQWVSGMLSQAIEVPEVRSELRTSLRLQTFPMMVLRVGLAPPTAGTPRRALSEVLTEVR